MPAPSRQLILGAIEGYTFDQIALAFTSLRATGYQGEVVLFHRRIDQDSLARLRTFGVTLIPLVPRGLWNPLTRRRHAGEGALGRLLQAWAAVVRCLPRGLREPLLRRHAERFFHIANARFVLAHAWLEQHSSQYDEVMITDVRDVYFQSDPFAQAWRHELCAFYEDPSITLRTDRNYREWIAAALGHAVAESRLDDRLSCCAITMGPCAAMREYLRRFSAALLGHRGREGFRFGLDSAIHNDLAWSAGSLGLTLKENFHGPVLTMGGLPPEALPEERPLRNRDRSIVNILHQYDRHQFSPA